MTQAALYFSRERRRDRQADVLFSGLSVGLGSASAGDQLPNGLTLPHYSPIGVSFDSSVVDGVIQVTTSRGETISAPGFVSGVVQLLGFFEKNVELFFTSQNSGSLTVHRLSDLQRTFQIASGEFS